MKARLYPSLEQGITTGIQRIFYREEHAETVVAQILRSNPKWGSRDRAFVAAGIYDLIRWWRLLWKLIEEEPHEDPEKIRQLIAVNEILNGYELPPAHPMHAVSGESLRAKREQLQDFPAVIHSIPDWLFERGQQELGNAWPEALKSMNEPAPVFIRVNSQLTTPAKLIQSLRDEGFEAQPVKDYPHAIEVARKGNLIRSKAFDQGWFEIQDAGSQAIAPFLDVKPGMTVLDACAGAGGKTLHLACLLHNRGRLIATDAFANRLDELSRRASRAHTMAIETFAVHSSDDLALLDGKVDRLLLDAPCSGTGVIRRKPDSKWKLTADFVETCIGQQRKILNEYVRVIRPGGKLVYATCSLFPSENENQVNEFLRTHPGFELEKSQTLTPSLHGTDGYYMALISRNE